MWVRCAAQVKNGDCYKNGGDIVWGYFAERNHETLYSGIDETCCEQNIQFCLSLYLDDLHIQHFSVCVDFSKFFTIDEIILEKYGRRSRHRRHRRHHHALRIAREPGEHCH